MPRLPIVSVRRSIAAVIVWLGALQLGAQEPVPPPLPVLKTPADNSLMVPLNPALTWTWQDELLKNAWFEQPLIIGWQVGGTKSNVWRRVAGAPTYHGAAMIPGNWAMATDFTGVRNGYGIILQSVVIPAEVTFAELSWFEWMINWLRPGHLPGPQLQVNLLDPDTAQIVSQLHVSHGEQKEFLRGDWVRVAADVSAFAGRTLLLAVVALNATPIAVEGEQFEVMVDGFSLGVKGPTLPEFEVLMSHGSAPLERVARIQALSWDAKGLEASTWYNWKVGAVGATTTNFSRSFSFITEASLIPRLSIYRVESDGFAFCYPTRQDQFYAVEQADEIGGPWRELQPAVHGDGSPQCLFVPYGGLERRFVRIQASQ